MGGAAPGEGAAAMKRDPQARRCTTPGKPVLLFDEQGAGGDARFQLLHSQLDGFSALLGGRLDLILLLFGEVDPDDALLAIG